MITKQRTEDDNNLPRKADRGAAKTK